MKTSLNIFKKATQMQGIMFTNSQHVLEAEARHSKMAQNQDTLCVLCLPLSTKIHTHSENYVAGEGHFQDLKTNLIKTCPIEMRNG